MKKLKQAMFPNQVDLRAKVEKCAIDNPDLSVEFIRELLIAKQHRSLAVPFNFRNDDHVQE